ncbi:MAG TPA: 50S ribosomal protein L30 [Chthonomonadales bacterium]|nr:50S ribosomal protein L30 [Chthonomonadales bacterium]
MADLKITLTRSPIGLSETQKRTARALGLTRMHKSVVRPDNDQIRGMVHAIRHLVTVAPAEEAAGETR